MRNLKILLFGFLIAQLLFTSCATTNRALVAYSPPATSKVEIDYKPDVKLSSVLSNSDADNHLIDSDWSPIDAVYTDKKSSIIIKKLPTVNQIGIKVEMSPGITDIGTYTPVQSGNNWRQFYDEPNQLFNFTIDRSNSTGRQNYRQLFTQELSNNRYIRFTVYDKFNVSDATANKLMSFTLKYRKSISPFWVMKWSDIIYTPVLLRLSGTASGFSYSSVAPAVGWKIISINTTSSTFPYVSLNLVGSITNYASTTTVPTTPNTTITNYQYAITYGAAIDIGGILQIGSLYSASEGKTYFAIGLAPQLFSQLIPSGTQTH